MQEEQEDTQ